jgi:hypothetical protein
MIVGGYYINGYDIINYYWLLHVILQLFIVIKKIKRHHIVFYIHSLRNKHTLRVEPRGCLFGDYEDVTLRCS